MKPVRSYLFVPGDRPERFDKAWSVGAGTVIIDLEDAVAPAAKAAARSSIAQWLDAARPVAVRINAANTEWFQEDLHLCRHPGVGAVMLPKAEDAAEIGAVRSTAPDAAVLPLVESARGFANAQALASAPGVLRLVFGSIDFQLDLGIQGEGEELLFFRSQLVLVSRLAGIAAPVDGVSMALSDPEALRAEVLRARRLGFGAKLCIHPRQVAVVESGFAPSPEERAWAMRVLEAADRAGGAAVALDGQMIDKPVVLRARALLS
jgi:citrate lyase subunit beta / citryl-CoA lyase